MKPPITVCALFLIILCCAGNTQTSLTLRDQGYCGTPQHQLNTENLLNLSNRTSGLNEPQRHFLPKKAYSIGESASFYTYNFVNEKYQQITATLRGTMAQVNIWVEDTEWNNFHIVSSDVQNILSGLLVSTPDGSISPDKGIISIIHEYFGLPPDFDGDGFTDFLITDIKDGWTEGSAFIAGYFNPVDQYLNGTIIDNSRISGSNERDILYIDSNPGIFAQSSDPYQQVLATTSHEYQHLIEYSYDRNEETWVNEGLSELSSFLCGYELRNPSDYLLDPGIDLTAWDNTLDNALKHYAKVALWTFYLYEKLGGAFIGALARTPATGIAGINSALLQQAFTTNFSQLLPDFFMAITLNDVSVNVLYGFSYERLLDLTAVPQKTVLDYPADISRVQAPYSLQLYSLENGDSLRIQFLSLPANNVRFILKRDNSGEVTRANLTGNSYQDPLFGITWSHEKMMIINNSASSGVSAFNALASQKYYVSSLTYSTTTAADLNINSTGTIPANQFTALYDSCALKSVSFNSLQSTGPVRVHVYQQQLQEGNDPAEITADFSNVLESEWTTLNLENLQIRRNKGETFDLGIEFLEYGVLGYSRTPAGLDRSFLKRSSDPAFRLLSSFNINNETLDGVWLIKIEYNAPLHNKPAQTDNDQVPYTITLLGPTPFPTPGNSAMCIQYTLKKPGQVKIEIFNLLGEVVKTVFNGYDQGPLGVRWWDGTNNDKNQVASGQYFLRFTFNKQGESRKILVLR
jgi:hypothetical protein